jgi:hypothetical protein
MKPLQIHEFQLESIIGDVKRQKYDANNQRHELTYLMAAVLKAVGGRVVIPANVFESIKDTDEFLVDRDEATGVVTVRIGRPSGMFAGV